MRDRTSMEFGNSFVFRGRLARREYLTSRSIKVLSGEVQSLSGVMKTSSIFGGEVVDVDSSKRQADLSSRRREVDDLLVTNPALKGPLY